MGWIGTGSGLMSEMVGVELDDLEEDRESKQEAAVSSSYTD